MKFFYYESKCKILARGVGGGCGRGWVGEWGARVSKF